MKQPDILFGRTGQELPCLRLCSLEPEVIASFTGPDGGLMTVNRGEKKHVDIHDPDVQFIDSDDEASNINNVPKNAPSASASGKIASSYLFFSILLLVYLGGSIGHNGGWCIVL